MPTTVGTGRSLDECNARSHTTVLIRRPRSDSTTVSVRFRDMRESDHRALNPLLIYLAPPFLTVIPMLLLIEAGHPDELPETLLIMPALTVIVGICLAPIIWWHAPRAIPQFVRFGVPLAIGMIAGITGALQHSADAGFIVSCLVAAVAWLIAALAMSFWPTPRRMRARDCLASSLTIGFGFLMGGVFLPGFLDVSPEAAASTPHSMLHTVRGQITVFNTDHTRAPFDATSGWQLLIDGGYLKYEPTNPLALGRSAMTIGRGTDPTAGWGWAPDATGDPTTATVRARDESGDVLDTF